MHDFSVYQSTFQSLYPDRSITPELALLFQYYERSNPKKSPRSVVISAMTFFQTIECYVSEFKKQHNSECLDKLHMDIFHCIAVNISSIPTEEALILSKKIREIRAIYPEISPYSDLTMILYVVLTYPGKDLKRTCILLDKLYKNIHDYLRAGNANLAWRKLSLKKISLYCWHEKYHPNISPQQAVSWVHDATRNNIYSKHSQHFPQSYPYNKLTFEIFTTGETRFSIHSNNYLSTPFLDALMKIENACRGVGNSVVLSFNLKQTPYKSLKKYIQRIDDELACQRSDDEKDLHNFYLECEKAIKVYQANNSKGLSIEKWLSISSKKATTTFVRNSIDSTIKNLIEKLKVKALQKVLFKNNSILKTENNYETFLKWILKPTPDYRIYTTGKKLSLTEWDMISKPWRNFSAHPTVILAKEGHGYVLYYYHEGHKKIPLNEAKERDVLNKLDRSYFSPESGPINVVSQERGIISTVLRSYLQKDLEKERTKKTRKIFNMAVIVFVYGQKQPVPLGKTHITPLEYLLSFLNIRYSENNDPINFELLKDFIRLFLYEETKQNPYFERRIHSSYSENSLVRFLQGGLNSLSEDKKPLSRLNIFKEEFKPVTVMNLAGEQVYWERLDLREFSTHSYEEERKEIVKLYQNGFRYQKKLNENALEESMRKKLIPQKYPAYMDIIRHKGKVVCFNLSTLVFPENPEESILLYVRLTVADKTLSEKFQRLTYLVTVLQAFIFMFLLKKPVVATFIAASYPVFLLVAGLPDVYPMNNCLNEKDIHRLINCLFSNLTFVNFKDLKDKRENNLPTKFYTEKYGYLLFNSHLYYRSSTRKGVMRPTDIQGELYNSSFGETEGLCPLVGYPANKANWFAVKKTLASELGNGLTIKKTVENLIPLYQRSLCYGNSCL